MDRKPFNHDRIVTLNCGLGRDSLTMLALVFEEKLYSEKLGGYVTPADLDAVVFSNTGAEWPHTYALIEQTRRLCKKHGVRFVVLEKGELDKKTDVASWEDIEAKAELGGYHIRPGIMADFESRATVASLGKGDCTDNHKIQPIRRFISDISEVRFGCNNRSYSWKVRKGLRRPHVTIIGIAADETSRLDNGGKGPLYVEESYPLVDMGIAKADEAPILERWGLNHVKKSGCFMCPYQPASWFWALSVTEPETYKAVIEYEATALARNPRMAATGFKAGGKPMTIPEVVEKWRGLNPDATVEAVLSKEYSRCTKDAKAAQKKELVSASSLLRKKAA
jgi:hypothetical protein